MKAARITSLVAMVLLGCSTSDPITRFAANPPQVSGKYDAVLLPPTASPEAVARQTLGDETDYKVVEIRQVIFGRSPSTAVLVDIKGQGQRIVLMHYVGSERGGWMTNVYDAR